MDIRNEAFISSLDLSVNKINFVKTKYPQFKGKGYTISIKENFFDTSDLDIKGRILFSGLESSIPSSHATEMATIIGGSGNFSNKGEGVVPQIQFTSSGNDDLFPDGIDYFNNLNIKIQNHSYGLSRPDNRYSAEAMSYDQQLFQNPALVHIMSAGNLGDSSSKNGDFAGIAGFSNLSGSFKMSKNSILVGAMDEWGNINSKNSKGPTYDGRIKPEIVAYGKDGTSDAAALVSGFSFILKQASQEWFSKELRSDALKALLIAGSNDINIPGPDYSSGYGSLDAQQSIYILENDQLIEDNISDSETKSFSIAVPDSISKFQVALCWTDPAAAESASKALINDIDMEISNSSGDLWLPWTLSQFPNKDSLLLSSVRAKDHINNCEFITIENPASGTYTITTFGFDISIEPQAFSLAYSFIPIQKFEWTYPLAEDKIESGQTEIIRWNSNSGDSLESMEYQINGADWITIQSNFDTIENALKWNVPLTNGTARLRSKVNSKYFTSEVFIINPDFKLGVEYNCETKTLISWNKIEKAQSYKIMGMGDSFLEELTQVNDTFVEFNSTNLSSNFFRIFPQFNGESGFSPPGLFYDKQGVNCYFKSASSVNYQNQFVLSSIELSTLRDVKAIHFYRSLDGIKYSLLNSTNPELGELKYQFEDKDPLAEFSFYRISVELESDESIITSDEYVYFPFPETFYVFPNPLRSGGFFNFLVKPDNQTLQLVNSLGQLKQTWKVNAESSEFDLTNLDKGTYILYLENTNGSILRSKILIW